MIIDSAMNLELIINPTRALRTRPSLLVLPHTCDSEIYNWKLWRVTTKSQHWLYISLKHRLCVLQKQMQSKKKNYEAEPFYDLF